MAMNLKLLIVHDLCCLLVRGHVQRCAVEVFQIAAAQNLAGRALEVATVD